MYEPKWLLLYFDRHCITGWTPTPASRKHPEGNAHKGRQGLLQTHPTAAVSDMPVKSQRLHHRQPAGNGPLMDAALSYDNFYSDKCIDDLARATGILNC